MAVGDIYKEEFTPEELAALGREPEGGATEEDAEGTGKSGGTEGARAGGTCKRGTPAEPKEPETEPKEPAPKSEEAQAAEAMGFRSKPTTRARPMSWTRTGQEFPRPVGRISTGITGTHSGKQRR